jgi:hypothetical protein
MIGWLARQTVRLYPLAYQRRYGEEMQALLEDQPPRAVTVFDLLKGALRAHLRPADVPAGVVDAADRVRASASGVLLCWVFFAAAGFGYYKSTEDQPFALAGHAHPLLRDAHLAVQALAVVASTTVVLGALPLIMAAVAHARNQASMRRAVLLPFVPLIVFAAATAAGIGVAHAHAPKGVGYGMAILWGLAGLACGTTCVLACRRALFATPAPADRLRAALLGATVVTGAMLAIAAATATYAIALTADAARLAAEPNGPFQLVTTSVSLIVQLVVMLGAGALASIATVRAWRVKRQLA